MYEKPSGHSAFENSQKMDVKSFAAELRQAVYNEQYAEALKELGRLDLNELLQLKKYIDHGLVTHEAILDLVNSVAENKIADL